MVRKKKVCAGCEQETYIYKNIDGKKYCKSCAYKLQPPKAIPKRSEKMTFKLKLKKEQLSEDMKFYLDLWNKTFMWCSWYGDYLVPPKCCVCGKSLTQAPTLVNFHHILEKRNYPQYRHDESNIAIVCADCHSSYESNPDNVPLLKELRKSLEGQHYLKQFFK